MATRHSQILEFLYELSKASEESRRVIKLQLQALSNERATIIARRAEMKAIYDEIVAEGAGASAARQAAKDDLKAIWDDDGLALADLNTIRDAIIATGVTF